MIERFLNSVAVLDTEATSNNPNEAEMIELGVARYDVGSWKVNDSLFKPLKSIPPACSEVCNITDLMVKDKKTVADSIDYIFDLLDPLNLEYYVAHNAQYDMAILNSNFKQVGVDFDVIRDIGKEKWICTYRLAKRLFKDDEKMSLKQTYLRYHFDLNLAPDLYPHRAGHDAYVCAHILVKLMELAIEQNLIDADEDIGAQLSKLSWDKIPVKVWPFGKHKGKPFSDLDDGFLRWAIINVNDLNEESYSYNPDLAEAVEAEINTRPNFRL